MKYCIQYSKNFRYNDVIDEIIFYLSEYNLLEKIKEQKLKDNQKIIIDITMSLDEPEKVIPILKMCEKEHNNFSVRVTLKQEKIANELKTAELSYFYNEYCTSADMVYALINKGASDVYVAEGLAFNLTEIGNYCKSKKVNVRVIPNIAQYKVGFKKDIPDPYKFFVRPEDVNLYEPFVDIFEIIAPEDRVSVIYEIYRNQQWSGDLSQLIIGFNEPFYNSGLIPLFGSERIKCKQKCMQEKCNLCQQMKELSDKIYNHDLVVKTPKDKEWKNETRAYKEIMQLVEKTAPSSDDKVSEE